MVEVRWLEQAQTDVPSGDAWLGGREKECLGRMRFEKRRADWRLGRWTVKRGVAVFLNLPCCSNSLSGIEICAAPSGAPCVFVEGKPAPVSVSLSHRNGLACCAVAPPGISLGCDLEAIEPRSDAFVADYFTSSERRFVAETSFEERWRVAALLWSGKESALKALGTGLRLDTRSIEVSPVHTNAGGDWSALRVRQDIGRDFEGWWQHSGSFVRTLVAAPPPLPPILLKPPG